MFPKSIQPNPKLEALRKGGLESPPVEYNIPLLLDKTKRIHVGWLFNSRQKPLLQKLCRLLDGYSDTHNTPGWGIFGHHLGLSCEILNVIKYGKLRNESYTECVLEYYAQKDDAKIQNIIQALHNMKRFDVIHQTQSYFNSLADEVLQENCQTATSINQENEEESGYYSLPTDYGEVPETSNGDSQVQRYVEGNIIRSKFIPIVPFILKELKEHDQCQTIATTIIDQQPPVEQEYIQTSEATRICNNVQEEEEDTFQINSRVVTKYDCIVMLTFAADGINFATEVAKNLRSKREDGLVIGVLILQEQERLFGNNPEQFISGSFSQVNYIVPIITEGYLEACMDTRSPSHKESMYLDCKYVRFIYTLMNKYYVRKGCFNKKIRCVIPDDLTHLTHKTIMQVEPIFETWVKSSSIHHLADRMLRRCSRNKYINSFSKYQDVSLQHSSEMENSNEPQIHEAILVENTVGNPTKIQKNCFRKRFGVILDSFTGVARRLAMT